MTKIFHLHPRIFAEILELQDLANDLATAGQWEAGSYVGAIIETELAEASEMLPARWPRPIGQPWNGWEVWQGVHRQLLQLRALQEGDDA